MSTRTLIPSARRLMGSLRDIGYEAPAAVAELVDNSIDAGARRIDIDVSFEGEDSWIRVADDGRGMTGRQLDEAMRYGSDRSYGDDELGGFGLGLKTASLSQCRCMTVASRRTMKGRMEIREWDLDDVLGSDAWDVTRLLVRESLPEALEPLRRHPGTVVLWTGLDRILAYRDPAGGRAQRGVRSLSREIRDHIAMVFHRFLSGEAARGRVNIVLDGEPVEPWDPFARDQKATRALAVQELQLGDNGDPLVRVSPFVLPPQERFSSAEAHQAAGGPQRWNRHQGFYFYRVDRLIQSGGWNRLRTLDEHSKLARIAVDIPRRLENRFGVNVSKMQVSVPHEVRPALRAIASGVVSHAQGAYRSALSEGMEVARAEAPKRRARAANALLESVDRELASEFGGDDVTLARARRCVERAAGRQAERTPNASSG